MHGPADCECFVLGVYYLVVLRTLLIVYRRECRIYRLNRKKEKSNKLNEMNIKVTPIYHHRPAYKQEQEQWR
jgi:hypothetical protein